MAIKPTRTVKVRSLADRLENSGVLLKRPGLKFIATLPTLETPRKHLIKNVFSQGKSKKSYNIKSVRQKQMPRRIK